MNFENIEIAVVQNPNSLSTEDLIEEYQKILGGYHKQKDFIDLYRQQIYTLKKDKELKDNLLKEELQLIAENYDRELTQTNKKYATDIADLQNRLTEKKNALEKFELENERLKKDMDTSVDHPIISPLRLKTCDQNETIVSINRIEYLEKIEAHYAILVEEIAQVKCEKSEQSSKMAKMQNEIDEMKEYYDCSQQNLKYKTDELIEAQNIIDSMQEKLVDIENELYSFRNDRADHNKKGNSLFAEVDDQRQQMRDLLNRQKQQYQMMKLKYEQSTGEINRMKRENADIHLEIKECVSMFRNADKFYKTKLNEQIGFLKTENNRLNEKLKQTQLEMDSLAKTQGINWLSSMLEYCENETKELNSKLISYGMKKCEAEGLNAQAQELAAKWRFEALKSRCIIINREMLLEQNDISFEKKVSNIRQMVEKQFNNNEEPIIDDIFCASIDNIRHDTSKYKRNSSQFNTNDIQTDNNWLEVREIIANINNGPSTSQSKSEEYSDDVTIYDNTIVMLPIEESQKDFGIQTKPDIEKPEKPDVAPFSIENKENTYLEEKNTENLIKYNIVKSNQNDSNDPSCGLNSSTLLKTNSSQDCQERVRQVNVEMFTVTLKRRDPPKIVNDN